MTIYNPYGGQTQLRTPNSPLEDIDWSGDVFADYLAIRDQMNQAKAAHDEVARELRSHSQREREARERKNYLAEQGKTEEDYDAMIEADHEVRRLEFAGRDLAARKAARLKEYQEALERFQRYDYGMKSITVVRLGIESRKRNIEIEQAKIEEQKMSEMRRFDVLLAARQKRIDADNELLTTVDDVIGKLQAAGLFEDCTLGDREMNVVALNMVKE